MKKQICLIFACSLFILLCIFIPEAKSNKAGSASNYSGALAIGTCAKSGCHTGSVPNSGPGSIILETSDIPAEGYYGGLTYNLEIKLESGGTTTHNYGFALSAVKSGSSTTTGLFEALDAETQAKASASYITHTLAGTNGNGNALKSFFVRWTAPAAGSGDVKFFYAGNVANNNGQNSGDMIYSGSLLMPEAPNSSLQSESENIFRIFPNPTSHLLYIHPVHQAVYSFILVDIQGRVVASRRVESGPTAIATESFAKGIYTLQVEQGMHVYTKKILLQ